MEWRYLGFAILLQSWAIIGGLKFGAVQFWVSSAINLFVNVYPIMLQRFNRVRVDSCLEKMQPYTALQLTGSAGS